MTRRIKSMVERGHTYRAAPAVRGQSARAT